MSGEFLSILRESLAPHNELGGLLTNVDCSGHLDFVVGNRISLRDHPLPKRQYTGQHSLHATWCPQLLTMYIVSDGRPHHRRVPPLDGQQAKSVRLYFLSYRKSIQARCHIGQDGNTKDSQSSSPCSCAICSSAPSWPPSKLSASAVAHTTS